MELDSNLRQGRTSQATTSIHHYQHIFHICAEVASGFDGLNLGAGFGNQIVDQKGVLHQLFNRKITQVFRWNDLSFSVFAGFFSQIETPGVGKSRIEPIDHSGDKRLTSSGDTSNVASLVEHTVFIGVGGQSLSDKVEVCVLERSGFDAFLSHRHIDWRKRCVGVVPVNLKFKFADSWIVREIHRLPEHARSFVAQILEGGVGYLCHVHLLGWRA